MLRPTERKKVQWSPHQSNKFVVGGNDLRLYEIRSSDSTTSSISDTVKHFSVLPPADTRPHEKKVISLVGAHTEIQSLKCFDWCLDPSEPSLLAVGLATGKVLLANLDGDGDSVKKEFVPRQVRTCNAVAWNPYHKHILATGLDKVRSDYSCLIWDVNETSATTSSDDTPTPTVVTTRDNSFNLSSIAATQKVERPIGQFANSEAVASVAWLPGSPDCLATGTGARWLRIYDMRDAIKPVNSVGAHSAKAIYGVCVDPHRTHCIASFSEESIIKLWDVRVFKEPVMQLVAPGASANNKIVQVAWCPTRGAGLLGSISKDENVVRVWNVNSGMLIQDEEVAKLFPASAPSNMRSGSLALKSNLQPSSSGTLATSSGTPGASSGPQQVVPTPVLAGSQSAANVQNPASPASVLGIPQLLVNSIARPTSPTPKDGKSAMFATSDIYDTSPELVSGFSWHPTKGQLLTVSINSVIDIMNLHEPIPLSFSSQSRLCFSSQKMMVEGPILMKSLSNVSNHASHALEPSSNTAQPPSHTSAAHASSASSSNPSSQHGSLNNLQTLAVSPQTGAASNALLVHDALHTTSPTAPQLDLDFEKEEALKGRRDISLVMFERAVRGYGGDAKVNRQLVTSFDNYELEYVWNWLNDMKFNLAKKASEFKGIYALMIQSKNSQPSKIEETMTFADPTPLPVAITNLRQKYPVFSSPERTFCLKMCGWGFASSAELAAAFDSSDQRGKLSRAVALAVFHLDIIQALGMLRVNAAHLTNDLRLVSLALAGFADTSSSQWRATIEPLRPQISDPYLSAVLAFLCSNNTDYWDVLYETDMTLRDKLAFACRFYDDDKLASFLERTKVQVVGQGRLTGLLLTGIDSVGGGVDLFQNYLDRTSDLQSVALILSHISHRKIKDPRNRIMLWIHMYRQLLDRWGLWMERAKFDVHRGEANPPPHVMARCNFCNATLTLGRDSAQNKAQASMSMGSRMGPGLQTASSPAMRWQDKKKISSCPSCRKPLPRCALCLLPMNVIPPSPENRQLGEGITWTSGFLCFDDWFSWCQTCKHGGHSGHLADWFSKNSVCPVSDCDCNCTFC